MHDNGTESFRWLLIAAALISGWATEIGAAEPNVVKPAASSKKSDNFFTTPSAGAGAAFAGAANLGYYIGALAGGPNADWQGYPKGGQGAGIDGAFSGGMTGADNSCALSDVSQLAKALQAPTSEGALPASTGMLSASRLPESQKQTELDGKDVYQAGSPVTCGSAAK